MVGPFGPEHIHIWQWFESGVDAYLLNDCRVSEGHFHTESYGAIRKDMLLDAKAIGCGLGHSHHHRASGDVDQVHIGQECAQNHPELALLWNGV